MRQVMVAALFVAAAFALGMTQAPSVSTPPASPGTVLEADDLQGGSCGDYNCQPPEDCHSCPQDCGDCCGNNRCEPPEDCDSCPADCC